MPNIISPKMHLLSSIIYFIDSEIRKDLNRGHITDENDYTSNLCSRIRNIGLNNFFKIQSFKCNKSQESRFGCDGIILFKLKDFIKVGLFEAKWPRVSRIYQWDKLNSKESHFHSQLNRQRKWSNTAAIWEMFYNELPVGDKYWNFDRYGSSCVWHELALIYDSNFIKSNQIWKNEDIIELFWTRPFSFFNRHYGNNLRYIILDMLSCKKGKPISLDNETNYFYLEGEEDKIKIPLPKTDGYEDRIKEFLNSMGLTNYLYFDIEGIF